MLATPFSLFTSVQTSEHFEQKAAEETEQCMDGKWKPMRIRRIERDGKFIQSQFLWKRRRFTIFLKR